MRECIHPSAAPQQVFVLELLRKLPRNVMQFQKKMFYSYTNKHKSLTSIIVLYCSRIENGSPLLLLNCIKATTK
jgi:hypothetical protein